MNLVRLWFAFMSFLFELLPSLLLSLLLLSSSGKPDTCTIAACLFK